MSIFSSPFLVASGKRSKKAVPSKVPAAKEVKKWEIFMANFSLINKSTPPIKEIMLPKIVKNIMYPKSDIDEFNLYPEGTFYG